MVPPLVGVSQSLILFPSNRWIERRNGEELVKDAGLASPTAPFFADLRGGNFLKIFLVGAVPPSFFLRKFMKPPCVGKIRAGMRKGVIQFRDNCGNKSRRQSGMTLSIMGLEGAF